MKGAMFIASLWRMLLWRNKKMFYLSLTCGPRFTRLVFLYFYKTRGNPLLFLFDLSDEWHDRVFIALPVGKPKNYFGNYFVLNILLLLKRKQYSIICPVFLKKFSLHVLTHRKHENFLVKIRICPIYLHKYLSIIG